MINLLPPETKEAYKYARHNRKLLHWSITCALCVAIGALLAGGGYLYMRQTINTTSNQIADTNKQLQAQNLTSVQKQVTDISNNLKLVVQVLSKEVLFSELLKQLASIMPSNTVLTNLAIVQTEGGVDITAQTADYNAATQLQVNLADPKNQIFSKADIVDITCTSAAKDNSYPCTVDIRALFATDNPFLFINDKKGTR